MWNDVRHCEEHFTPMKPIKLVAGMYSSCDDDDYDDAFPFPGEGRQTHARTGKHVQLIVRQVLPPLEV